MVKMFVVLLLCRWAGPAWCVSVSSGEKWRLPWWRGVPQVTMATTAWRVSKSDVERILILSHNLLWSTVSLQTRHVVLSSLECPQGLWGEECAESCDCSGRGTCSAHDGSCDCDPGWTGLSCQEGIYICIVYVHIYLKVDSCMYMTLLASFFLLISH